MVAHEYDKVLSVTVEVKNIQVVPRYRFMSRFRAHPWVNSDEEGSCCKNRAKVSCNSSSIKPQNKRYSEDLRWSSLRFPIDYQVGTSPLIDSRAVLTIWIAHVTRVTPWVSEWGQGWHVTQGRSRIKSRS